ncbi:hypothetical protein B5X24_HaOG212951 [Helicoverpa armigera]|uniref:Serpin domain-containing protein n=1 Tax=Helicoverpa armigera TaxID=29058 RepID=A0A2W1B5Y5_HELAM|nr:hypothetical protein B5X24_HaOG212951 [Helicoverpa armigera]
MFIYGIIFSLLILIPFNSASCDNGTIKDLFEISIYKYTYKLMRKIYQDSQSNFVVSPLSSWMLLSALSLGASNNTLQEMTKEAKLHPDNCFNNLYLQYALKLMKELSTLTASTFERSSTIFFDKSLPIKEYFLRNVSKTGVCNVREISFLDDKVTETINELVESDTNDAIEEMVTSVNVTGVLALMLDALYFTGAWKIPFPFEDTTTDTFYNKRGEPIGDVSMMYLCDKYNFTWIKKIQSHVLELPYGNGRTFSMLIFLPKISIKRLISLLPTITISYIFKLFKVYKPDFITVQIPRFKIFSSINLKKHLISMGIKDVFDYQQASFPDISEQQLFVSNFIQKASIVVDEDGEVEAIPQMTLLQSRMFFEQFTANKPFMFMVVDRNSHIPIFTGVYTEPSICSRGENSIDDVDDYVD